MDAKNSHEHALQGFANIPQEIVRQLEIFTSFADAAEEILRKFVGLISRIPAEQLEAFAAAADFMTEKQYVERIILNGVDEAIEASKAGDSTLFGTRKRLHEFRGTFSSCMTKLNKNKELDRETKLAALGAIEAAFMLGGAVGETAYGPNIVAKLKQESTKAASAARRADVVQEIIEGEALAYWKRHPNKRAKPSDTARAIFQDVTAKLSDAGNVPDAWRSGNEPQRIERIRKRLSRV